jgi:membrane-associated protein
MGRLLDQIQEVFGKILLLDMPGLMEVLKQPEITTAAYITLALVIFTETGLLIGFFLPGDSLLVSVGLVAHGADWSIVSLIALLSAAAILGDTVGYWIGAKSGPRLFRKEKSFFFRKDHLLAAQAFYEKHGGKTIILARFMPFVRTFAPVVAGIGRMEYRRFLAFNVVGGVLWVASMLLLGYWLIPTTLDPLLQRVFGPEFQTAKHIEKAIILIVLASISPGLYAGARAWLAKRRASRVSAAAEVHTAV